MSVQITLACDGCEARSGPHILPHRRFNSFDGKGYGFGVWHQPGLDEVDFPKGWLWSDPVTGLVYCPECWASITSEVEAAT